MTRNTDIKGRTVKLELILVTAEDLKKLLDLSHFCNSSVNNNSTKSIVQPVGGASGHWCEYSTGTDQFGANPTVVRMCYVLHSVVQCIITSNSSAGP